MTQPPVESGDQPSQQTGEQGGDQGTGLSGGLSLETQNALLAMQQTNKRAMRGMFESFNRQVLEFQERLSGLGLPGSSTTSATAGPSSAPGTILLPGPPEGGSLSTSMDNFVLWFFLFLYFSSFSFSFHHFVSLSLLRFLFFLYPFGHKCKIFIMPVGINIL